MSPSDGSKKRRFGPWAFFAALLLGLLVVGYAKLTDQLSKDILGELFMSLGGPCVAAFLTLGLGAKQWFRQALLVVGCALVVFVPLDLVFCGLGSSSYSLLLSTGLTAGSFGLGLALMEDSRFDADSRTSDPTHPAESGSCDVGPSGTNGQV